ncbi:MAG: DUF418 domain-containing protein [Burkholderiales bacterium]
MTPTSAAEREPVLDALRGFAILGILAVNIEVMRGSEWLVAMAGGSVAASALPDRIVQFAIGWLATGKFISTLAILFGIGAALIAGRSLRAGESPRTPLARRYVCLMVFGIAHMLLFPGDILFLYGLTGLILLAFVMLQVRTLLAWSATLLATFSAMSLRQWVLVYRTDAFRSGVAPTPDSFTTFLDELRVDTVVAFTTGGWSDIFAVHAWQALLLQTSQLYALPWVLALFLFGFAIARAGILNDLGKHRAQLRRGAFIGLVLGLPANIGLGLIGPLAAFGTPPLGEPIWVTRWAAFAQTVGAPVLAIGYACALSLLWLRRGAMRPLAAVGRMALTAYLLESALTLAVFAGLRLYDRLSTASALLVVFAIWAILLAICPLWLRWFRFGPVEWLWRSLTYGRLEALRVTRA